MKIVNIHSEYITLQQLLKMEDIISSGGEAKHYLSLNSVLLNGETENRRGKKIYSGDILVINGKEFTIE